ncbi:MAG: hypothetical protein GF329_06165 [Candidatus Lokiarchaeota archaeon]|nr:hypothetical protein [Candidatus Lokiarchaeota archaeon]
MKVIGIIGSPRKDGNTTYLMKRVLEVLDNNFETEMIFLKELDINPCEGCHSCVNKGNCIIEDDMQLIFEKLKKSSVILLSSPVYMGGTTSRLRIFMERTWHLRKGQLKNKIASYIVVGRRDLGVAVNEIEEYFSRIKALKLSGIIGYGFEKNDINKDHESLNNVARLSNQILNLYKTKNL